MTKQLPIDFYYKSKHLSKSILNMEENKVVRKRNLSLRKSVTPIKSPRVNKNQNNDGVIDLCTEDEDTYEKNALDTDISDSSQATVIYSPVLKSSPNNISPQTKITTGLKVRSPGSINKYYSPSKKRAVVQKSPVRRELFKSHHTVASPTNSNNSNNIFKNACEGMDDKTIFLIKIINQYLSDNSMKYLLNENSQVILEKCMHILKPGMRLVCRLFWRKERWYNMKTIKSILKGKDKDGEINKLDDEKFITLLRSLTEEQLIISSTDDKTAMTFEDYASVLNANDIKQICKDLKLTNITKKQDSLDALKCFSNRKSIARFFKSTSKATDNSRRVLRIMAEKAGPCYRLSDIVRRTIHKLYVLIYLGIDYTLISEKKLELALINDKIGRETYPVDSEVVLDSPKIIFHNSDEFERYFKALNVYENYLQETDVNKRSCLIEDVYESFKNYNNEDMFKYKSLQIWLHRFTHIYFYVKIMNDGIQDLKKINKYNLALDILSTLLSQSVFSQHKRAQWFSEKSLLLLKIGQNDKAAKVLLEGLKSNLAEDAIDILRSRVAITAKNAEESLKTELLKYADKERTLEKNIRGVHIYKQPMDRTETRGKLKYETRTADGRIMQDVEEFGIQHYLQSGEFTNGKHWEGRIVNTIFFLLFWDIIYSTKPPNCQGIFLTRFQKYPLDMFSTCFYENRKEYIDNRLKQIQSMEVDKLLNMMLKIWESRPEGEVSGLHREREGMQWAQVAEVVKCAGGRKLAALCRRLVSNYSQYSVGFPDLTLWNQSTGQLRFVEVKSDTDKPSLKQLQWMHYLQQNDIDTEFCYVGVHTKRIKSRAT